MIHPSRHPERSEGPVFVLVVDVAIAIIALQIAGLCRYRAT